jgi:hypothetical protein
MELIWTQPGFKHCNEPLNLRNPSVRKHLGITRWTELCNEEATIALRKYFRAFCEGRLHFKDPRPLHEFYRPLTRRIVFKILHGGEDRINWFRDTFNGRIVYLLRHPIAVTVSREAYPRLDALLNSDYRRHFKVEQLRYAMKILDSGTSLERGVLAWCLENAVPLRDLSTDWTVVSYEQLVLNPQPVIDHLAAALALPNPERMYNRLLAPSAVKGKSNQETREALEKRTAPRVWLIEKWRKQIDETAERRAMDILEYFNIDAYKFGDILPATRLWMRSENPQNSAATAERPTPAPSQRLSA